MDSLVYRYQTNRNRLTHVDDPGGVAGNHSFDVDDQDTNTYTYDASGNMIGDTASGITAIVWTPSNKIQSITKGSTSKLEYTYDAMGNRVVKRYYQPASTLKSTTWYARDAQGNILSVYERPHADSAIKQSEVHIYGSSRLGIEQRGITYSTSNYAWIGSEQHRNAGSKRYELTDHLGNVRVTISDLLIARPAGFGDTTQDAEVIDRRDYYPFGMEMPGRRWRASGEDAARFGFNGKENDNEVKGEGNQQEFGARIHDPRTARWMSVDPLASKYPSYSPYVSLEGNPVLLVDPDGKEVAIYFDKAAGKLFIKNLDHYKEGLPTVMVNAKDYKFGGIRNENGVLTQNQVLVIENVFSGGKSDAKGNVTRNLQRNPKEIPIPNGAYDLLEYEKVKSSPWYKLDPIDESRFDDEHQGQTNSKGETRTAYRLHLGSLSYGCITVCDPNSQRAAEWNVVSIILNSTSKTEVPKMEGMQGLVPGATRLRYGTVTVGGVDRVKVIDNTKKKSDSANVTPDGVDNERPD